jgi:hypothetical protein
VRQGLRHFLGKKGPADGAPGRPDHRAGSALVHALVRLDGGRGGSAFVRGGSRNTRVGAGTILGKGRRWVRLLAINGGVYGG